MQRFMQLFIELDRTTRKSERLEAIERYFIEAEPASAAWALHILTGNKLMRALPSKLLRRWAAEAADVPEWLFGECYDAVGDFSETISLLLPEDPADGAGGPAPSLRDLIETYLLPLQQADDATRREIIRRAWSVLSRPQRFLMHKLISGNFRAGVAANSVAEAVARVAGVSKPVMIHRLMRRWRPTAEEYADLLNAEAVEQDPAQPYPFFLATAAPDDLSELGHPSEWLAEYKWDGIRAQVIHRDGSVIIWSRGEEIINGAFPEIVQLARRLPSGTVLDGELLAWEDGRPLPFAVLQRRINRKQVEPTFWPEVPIAFLAFDLLESGGHDKRGQPQEWRRRTLARLLEALSEEPTIRLSPLIEFDSWSRLAEFRSVAGDHGAEGVMIKRRDAAYQVGRPRGDWWKWKVDPFTLDVVLMYAQRGSGRRASLFTDYTFGVWDGDELKPIAKAYSGLTDAEISEVDKWVRGNTLEGRGGFRVVRPELVFELAFEGIQRSKRHRSGLALRFPRMNRWRRDKLAQEADTLAGAESLLRE